MNLLWVIDDDPFLTFAVKSKFNRFNAFDTIENFENGKEGFEELSLRLKNEQRLPDIILLDINMPVMNGWEFLDEVSHEPELFQACQVYIFSSSSSQKDKMKASEYPIAGYILKPISDEKIMHLIENLNNKEL